MTEGKPPLETIRLTIELTRDAETPTQWTSKCLELDVVSAGMTPERALEAVAEAVRMMVEYEVEHSSCSPSQAIDNIAAEVFAMRMVDLPDDVSAAPRVPANDET